MTVGSAPPHTENRLNIPQSSAPPFAPGPSDEPSTVAGPDGRIALNSQELKRLRRLAGLSQEALAERCLREHLCVSIASIKRAEAGNPVLYRTARHLATTYKVDLDRLLPPHAPQPTPPQPAPPATATGEDALWELRSVVALHVAIDPSAPGASAASQLVHQFGGIVWPGNEPWLKAVFGVPRAYASDAVRCMQCATEVARVMGSECRFVALAMQEWTARSPQTPPLVDAALRGFDTGRAGSIVVHADVISQLTGRYVFGPAMDGAAAWRSLLHASHSDRSMQLPLIGRYAEIQQFKGLLEITQVCQGGHVVCVRGAPGIGKTRLMHEFADIARQSHFDVHEAAVLDFGTEADGSAFAQLLRGLLRLPPRTADSTRPGIIDARLKTLGLAPENEMFYRAILGMPQTAEQQAVYAAMAHATRSQRSIEALRQSVLREAIARPQVLIIEDVHWGDAILFETLGALLAQTQEAPVIWLLTSRHENDPWERHIRPFCADVPLTVFGLVPLRALEAETLALQFGQIQPSYRQRCVERAQGNPLFLTQMLLSGNELRLPDSLKRLVQSQMDRQTSADRRALRTASAIGQRFSISLLREVLRAPAYSPDGPVACHLLKPVEPGIYQFVHDLVMQCIYESMVPTQRDFLHQAIAEAFRQRDTTLCALHLDRARIAEAPAMFLAAIDEKMAARQYRGALALVEQALAIDYAQRDDHGLAMREAQAAAKIGLMQQARTGYERARDLATNAVQRIDAVVGLAHTLNVLEELDVELQLIDATLPLAHAAGHEAALANLLYLKGNLYFPRGDFEGCRRHHEQALAHSRTSRASAIEAKAWSGLGDSYYAEGCMRRACDVFSACLALCRQHGLADVEASNLFMLGTVRIYLGEMQQALRDALDSAELGLRVGNRRAEIVSRLTASWVLVAAGDTVRAREQIEMALASVQALQAARFEPFLLESLARACLVDGQQALARQHMQRAWSLVEARNLYRFIGPWVLGTLALVSEDAAQRSEAIMRGTALLEAGCVGHNHYQFRLAAAEACLTHGDPAQALLHLQALRRFCASEPCAWVDVHAGLVEAYAHWLGAPTVAQRDRLAAMRLAAAQAGYVHTMPVLHRLLKSQT